MKRQGFTLAEVLVVIGIFAIVFVLSATIFFSNNRFYLSQTDIVTSTNSTRIAADRLQEYGRMAVGIIASNASYTTGAETVIFQIPSIDVSGQVISSTYDLVTFSKDLVTPTTFLMILEPDPASSRTAANMALTFKLVSVNFTYGNPTPSSARNVEYNIQIDQQGRQSSLVELQGGITLRNK